MRILKRKLAFWVVACLVLAAALSACGQGTAPTGEETPQQEVSQEALPAAEPANEAEPADAAEQEAREETETAAEPQDRGELVYGTATLSFREFYSGDVSSVESLDAVSSATTGKSGTFPNAHTDFVDAETNADGYRILGVRNVPVAVYESELEAYTALNDSFVPSEEVPAQFKPVSVVDGEAVYGPTEFVVLDTVTNARAELKTSSNWGDYEIDVYDNEGDDAKNYLRRDRQDEWTINSQIMGIILETSDGFKVGMEFLQSIWIQPWEVSFNVSQESMSNAHIADGGRWDNIAELKKLVGKTVTGITYIMPDGVYVYTFDGIYIKPAYTGDAAVKATPDGSADILLEGIPADLENPTVTVIMGTGRGRSTLVNAEAPADGKVTMKDADGNPVNYDPQETYSVMIGSDNYADLVAAVPMSEGQRAALEALVKEAKEVLETRNDDALSEHLAEAEALLQKEDATSGEATELSGELDGHLSPYGPAEESGNGGSGEHGGNGGGHH